MVRTESFQVTLKPSRTTSKVQAQPFEMPWTSKHRRAHVTETAEPPDPTRISNGAEGAQLPMLAGQGRELWLPMTTIQSDACRAVPTPATGVSGAPTLTMMAEGRPTAQDLANSEAEANMITYAESPT